MFFHQLAFDHRSVGNDLRTAVLENKCATSAGDRIGDAARAAQWNSAKEKWQTNPMILRAVRFEQIDSVLPAKLPKAQ